MLQNVLNISYLNVLKGNTPLTAGPGGPGGPGGPYKRVN